MHVGTGFLVLLLPIFGVWWLLNVVFLPPGRLRKDQHGRPYKMPPGPKGVLLFGNLLQFARLPKLSNRSFKNQVFYPRLWDGHVADSRADVELRSAVRRDDYTALGIKDMGSTEQRPSGTRDHQQALSRHE